MIENLDEEIEPVLDPLLGRALIKKGKAIKIGDKEIEYHPQFQLFLHTKMANPHYKPELQAQTTLINFTVTRQGLKYLLFPLLPHITNTTLVLFLAFSNQFLIQEKSM